MSTWLSENDSQESTYGPGIDVGESYANERNWPDWMEDLFGEEKDNLTREQQLQQHQLDLLGQQEEDAALMRPFVLQGMGLMEDADTGELRYMTEEEKLAGMSEVDREQYEITKLAQERQRQAYAGELPISPALEQSLKDEEAKLKEALSRKLGDNFMQTTAGSQAWNRFAQRADLVREEARRGELAGGGSNAYQGLSYLSGSDANRTASAGAYPGRTSGVMSGYSGILDRMSDERRLQDQIRSQQQAGRYAGLGQLVGSGIGAYGTYAGLAAFGSSKILKENIEPIESPIEKIIAIRGVDFDWKDSGKHDVGVIAEEVEKIMPEAVAEVHGIKHVFYHKIIPLLVEAIKEQQVQINTLKEGRCHG